MSTGPLPPGAWLGVLGGGQLGRMFAQAAQRLGYRVLVLDPARDGPDGQVADDQIVAAYDNTAALADLASRCAACTTEFESVPAGSLAYLASCGLPVSPPASALAVCQHRAREKALFAAQGVPCAPWALVDSPASLAQAQSGELFPGILKTATLGYDGKGQVSVARPDDLPQAWEALRGQPCVLERRLPLAVEISVIVARGHDGHSQVLSLQQNQHRDGILAVTQWPAPAVSPELAQEAAGHAHTLVGAMGYVGVLCVEFFVLGDGRLVANEMAPRPHNSGHASIDACDSSQFDAQVRVLARLPLRAPQQHSAAVMLNLLGDLWWPAGQPDNAPREPDWQAVVGLPGVHLHLYGKAEARPGRKMGHLTVTAPTLPQAQDVARQVARHLGLPAMA
ncbi:MAG: 5-(carboxyamino)imidazole ribonucleotide synthase [Rubrivivax sp.]